MKDLLAKTHKSNLKGLLYLIGLHTVFNKTSYSCTTLDMLLLFSESSEVCLMHLGMAVSTLRVLVYVAFIVVLSGAALGLCVNSMNDIVVNMLVTCSLPTLSLRNVHEHCLYNED